MTFHVAVAGAGLVALGTTARLSAVVAFGGAMLLAVAIGRAMALVTVTRLRSSGFEMTWTGAARVHRTRCGQTLALQAELRNRSTEIVRGASLRPIGSSMLALRVEPAVIDLPPGARASVELQATALRVGRWGVHGIALEVRGIVLGGEGLYEVPLLFSSPLGIEALPAALLSHSMTSRGGRSRVDPDAERLANLAGEGDQLRELRDHVPGDPFKRIAWKASARRGRLLVREMDRQERDVVWLVLDASVELWSGRLGRAPLDLLVEDLASIAVRHLRRGDRVGLVVAASRLRSWIAPNGGAAHASAIAGALASAASCIDSDRSELDEYQVAQRVAEHARPLDPKALGDIPKGNLNALAARASELRARAPFAPRLPFAYEPRERELRHYLAAFGIESPPRVEGEHPKSEETLVVVLERLAREKPRPGIVHVWAPAPRRADSFARSISVLRRRRIEVRWSLPQFEAGIGGDGNEANRVAAIVDEAVRIRAHANRTRARQMLHRFGIHVQRSKVPGELREEGPEPGAVEANR